MAHPHVWVKVRTELIAEGNVLVGLRHTWVFDRDWLNSQLEEHDKDRDGHLTKAELGPVEEESKVTLGLFKFFTVVRTGGARIPVVEPRDLSIDYHGSLLGLSFTVRLSKSIKLDKANLLLEVYDGTYFSSFELDGPEAVRFAGDAPRGCVVSAGMPSSAEQMRAFRLVSKQLGAEAAKIPVPKSASIVCGSSASQVESNGAAAHQQGGRP